MLYRSTRSEAEPVSGARAILEGLAPDGGLYVPLEFPRLDPRLLEPEPLDYPELAFRVLRPFLPSLPETRLRAALAASAARFSRAEVCPLRQAGELSFLELFHGPTLAFKDLALTLFGSLLSMAREETGLKDGLLVLTATSGDTGKAALAGLADLPGIRVAVFYPAEGVSQIQALQMRCHEAENALVLGIRGNFDEAQRGVKAIFSDPRRAAALAKRGWRLSSANSINIGRLLPQIAYYVAAYRAMRAAGRLGPGEDLDLAVPTGNFGDVLAARWAKSMGLPIGRLIVATNRNRVLADFFQSGLYDRRRSFHRTESPSMDILVSSNLERLVFEASGRDSARIAGLMRSLAETGEFRVSDGERAAMADFLAGSAEDEAAAAEIARVYRKSGCLLDTHTATASAVLRSIRARESSARPTVIVATASPFKFPAAVARAIGLEAGKSELETASRLAEAAGLELPAAIAGLAEAPERHKGIVDTERMDDSLEAWLDGGAL